MKKLIAATFVSLTLVTSIAAPVASARHRTGLCTGACAYPLPT